MQQQISACITNILHRHSRCIPAMAECIFFNFVVFHAALCDYNNNNISSTILRTYIILYDTYPCAAHPPPPSPAAHSYTHRTRRIVSVLAHTHTHALYTMSGVCVCVCYFPTPSSAMYKRVCGPLYRAGGGDAAS